MNDDVFDYLCENEKWKCDLETGLIQKYRGDSVYLYTKNKIQHFMGVTPHELNFLLSQLGYKSYNPGEILNKPPIVTY